MQKAFNVVTGPDLNLQVNGNQPAVNISVLFFHTVVIALAASCCSAITAAFLDVKQAYK